MAKKIVPVMPRVQRRCYLVDNPKKIRLCRKCKEVLEGSMGFGRKCPRCYLYYVDRKTYKRYKDIYILMNPEYLEGKGTDNGASLINSKSLSSISNVKQGKYSITAHDLIVRSAVFRCSNKLHRLQDIQATFTIIDSHGNVSNNTVPAGYCPDCNTYYIMDSVFQQLENSGVPVCRIVKRSSEIDHSSAAYNGSVYNNFATESILKRFGYSVSQEKDLSEEQRRNILSAIVDYEVLTKSEIDSYISNFIRMKKSQRNDDGSLRYKDAIEKWISDRKWLNNYKIGTYKEIQAKGIIVNR